MIVVIKRLMSVMMTKFFVIILSVLICQIASANQLMEGVWRHSEKPAWLSIKFEQQVGRAVVYEHQQHRENEGLIVLKDIVAVKGKENSWTGKMFAADINGFIAAALTMPSAEKVIVKMKHKGTHHSVVFLREAVNK